MQSRQNEPVWLLYPSGPVSLSAGDTAYHFGMK